MMMSALKKKIFDFSFKLQLMDIATVTADHKPRVRYVVGKADLELNFRFSTHLDSRKVSQLRRNPNVHAILGASHPGSSQWLQIEGVAQISTTKEERNAFWFEGLEPYFDGPNDPNYCIVIIRPIRIEFCSTGSPSYEVWQPGR
jgi:general stress protein 26